MTQTGKTILWDFDGTLAFRPRMWRAVLMEVLNKHEPGHNVDEEQIRLYLRDGFPWHQPEKPHHHLSTPRAWWTHVEAILARAYCGAGFDVLRASELARLAHERLIEPEGYVLHEDTLPALEYLSQLDWNHVILSNHIPELPDIVGALPLSSHISQCVSSALTGYEKPNPEVFRIALEISGKPEKVWMIGDNIDADVKGAESVGIPAILVRTTPAEFVKYFAADLMTAASIIEENSPFIR